MLKILTSKLLQATGRFLAKFKQESGFLVLIYHSVCKTPRSVIDVQAEMFERQLCYMEDQGYKVLSLPDVLLRKELLPSKSVVITFDDGFDDFFEIVVPILQKHNNTPATVFPVTKFVLDPKLPFEFVSGQGKKSMNASQVEDVSKLPFVNVGSHTHTHVDLVKARTVAEFEASESLRILQQLTGKDEFDFCYPWASHDKGSRKVVSKYFRSACIGRGGGNIHCDPYMVRRIPIKNESLVVFARRLQLEFFIEDFLRDVLVRYH